MTNPIKEAYTEVFNTMNRYYKFGASDSEPRCNFMFMARDLLAGEPHVDYTPQQWELYTADMDCGPAASALNVATKRFAEVVLTATRVQVEEFKHYIS